MKKKELNVFNDELNDFMEKQQNQYSVYCKAEK